MRSTGLYLHLKAAYFTIKFIVEDFLIGRPFANVRFHFILEFVRQKNLMIISDDKRKLCLCFPLRKLSRHRFLFNGSAVTLFRHDAKPRCVVGGGATHSTNKLVVIALYTIAFTNFPFGSHVTDCRPVRVLRLDMLIFSLSIMPPSVLLRSFHHSATLVTASLLIL